MGRKLFLPLTIGAPTGQPTVDAVRKRLGGRASTETGAGELVTLRNEGGVLRTGVVLFVKGEDVDVWIAEGVVRRARRADTSPSDTVGAHELMAVAGEARLFGGLVEGQRVRFLHTNGVGFGTLVEKCRFGGLIERVDGVVLGVGFRRVWAHDDLVQN